MNANRGVKSRSAKRRRATARVLTIAVVLALAATIRAGRAPAAGMRAIATSQSSTSLFNAASFWTIDGTMPGAPVVVNLQPGWNLIAVPPGATLGPGPLPMAYTYQAGDTDYMGVQNNQSGVGYWQFLDHPATLSIPSGSPITVTIPLPAGHWIMVGNPGSHAATVTGADIIYTYNRDSGYQQATTLQPGQGAWVYSAGGGMVTISG